MDLSDDAVRGIVAHLASLRAEHGEVFAAPDLVEPTGEYFPDAFALEPESIERLLHRMMTYAPLSTELDVELAFLEPEGEGGGGCGSGACGTGGTKVVARGGAVETPDGYGVLVSVADVGDPKLLTASLARSIGRLVLFEAGEEIEDRDEGALAELTAVASGLGLILLNGASVYKKGCGGMRNHQGTHLGVEELALAVALFLRATGNKPGSVRRHLEVTQREAFDARSKLVRALADAPETLADGVLPVEERRGLLSRLFARSDDDALGLEAAAAKAKKAQTARSEDELRRLAEMKALVDEALQDP